MEYEDEGGSPGSVPEFGAIFMANCATKKESFRRKLLGLPPAQVNFVKRVKSGLILFLFEFEKRELYGVYQASSHGVMNIFPHAFDSSGKQFPAQRESFLGNNLSGHSARLHTSDRPRLANWELLTLDCQYVRFTVIWFYKPLLEHEFRDAKNYYSNKKFNFGLSEEQVHRLLYLFSSRKSENRVPQRQFCGLTSLSGRDRILGNEKVNKRNRLKFADEDSPEHEGTVSGIRKRVVEGSMDLMRKNIDFNYDERTGYSLPVSRVDLRDSLYNSRRLGKENQSLYHDTIKTEDTKDALMHSDSGAFLTRARRDLCDDMGQVMDIRGDKHSRSDYGFRSKRVETFEIPQNYLKRPNYDQRLFLDQKVDYDHSSISDSQSIISKNQCNETFLVQKNKHIPSEDGFRLGFGIPQTELKRPIDDQSLFMDRKVDYVHNSNGGNRVSNYLAKLKRVSDDYEQIRLGRLVDNDITPIVFDRLDKVRRVTDDDRRQIPAEQFSSPLDYEVKLNYRESSNNVDEGLGLVTSAVLFGHPLDRTKQLDNKYVLLKNDGVDNAYTLGNNVTLPLSTGYADVYHPGQQASIKSSKPTLEAYYSLGEDQHKSSSMFPNSVEERMYVTPYPTSHDSVVTRSVPYNPDFSEVNGTPLSVKGLISQSDGSLCRVNEVCMHDNQDPYEHYDPRVVKSSGGYREKMGNPSITDEIYECMSPFSSRIYDRTNMSPCSEFNEQATAAEDMDNNKLPETVTDSTSSDIQDLLIKYGTGGVYLGSSSEKINDSDIDTYQDLNAMPTDSENRRTSVFTRLSLSMKKRGQKKRRLCGAQCVGGFGRSSHGNCVRVFEPEEKKGQQALSVR